MAKSVWNRIRSAARSAGRNLTPPGHRTPIEESLQQKPGLSAGTPSPAGQHEAALDGWQGKA